MTRLAPATVPTRPPRDDQPPTTPYRDGAERIADLEQRLRDAEERAHKAQQRAIEAEHRADRGERRIDALLRALETRGPIDQAKGVVMAAFGVDPDAAFEALVWVSQNANTKLAAVVERFLVDVRGIDLGARAREELTMLLADLGSSHGQHVA